MQHSKNPRGFVSLGFDAICAQMLNPQPFGTLRTKEAQEMLNQREAKRKAGARSPLYTSRGDAEWKKRNAAVQKGAFHV
jgi:hypothetical protein